MNDWQIIPALRRIGGAASKLPPIYWLLFLCIGGYFFQANSGAGQGPGGEPGVGRGAVPGASRGASDERGVRLHAQFARACPAGWRSRTTQFGDGRIGVNTVFRSSPTNSTRDRNILEMYFSGVTGRETAPPIPLGPGYVWVVDAHDTDDSYQYQDRGVRACWQISGRR